MATDLSGATVGELQVQGDVAPRADLVAVPDVQPDMTKHDPVTFAALTGQRMLEAQHAQNLLPTADDIKAIESKALEDANNYHRTVAEQAQRERSQLGARQMALTPAVTKEGVPIPGSSIAEQEEAVRRQSQEVQKQWEQTGEIHQAKDADIQRINGFEQGYQTADKLQKYHLDMAATTPGAAGWLKSHILGFATQPDITSQPTKDFNAYLESSIVPLGRGVFGDAATAATKESIQANMREMLSNKDDNPLSAGHKTFMLKDRIMQNLITDRNNAEANHVDTTPWDKAIGRLSGNYNSDETRQFAPSWAGGPADPNQIVKSGTSAQANASIANVTAGANAGVQVQNQAVQQPLGQAGAYTTPPGYTPSQPPQPSYGRQSAQAAGAAAGGALKTAGSVIGAGLTSTGELAGGLGATINWLGGLLPENWPQQTFQQPRPWETTSNQFVGTGQ